MPNNHVPKKLIFDPPPPPPQALTSPGAGLYSKHVPMVPVLVELWSGLVNFGSWWPDQASYKNINEKKKFKM